MNAMRESEAGIPEPSKLTCKRRISDPEGGREGGEPLLLTSAAVLRFPMLWVGDVGGDGDEGEECGALTDRGQRLRCNPVLR